jgi:foldase protein PrsA
MSKAHRVIAGLVTLTLSLSLAACTGGSIGTANGQPISKADFDTKLEGSPAAKGVLQQMVQESLLNQYAKDNNISVSDDEVAKKENDLRSTFPAGSWDDMLKSRGLSEDDVHKALRLQLLLDKAVGKDIKIDDAQVKAFFDKNHVAFDKQDQARARHILVADLPTANKVEALLKQGAKFEDLAKQYSIDPASKDKGGELGFFRRGQMVPPFEKYVFSNAPLNQTSPPIKSAFGYHIIQVEERQPGEKATLANAHDKIVEQLRQQQEAPLIQSFMSNLMTKANIQISDTRFAGLFPTPLPSAAPAEAPSASPAPAATK